MKIIALFNNKGGVGKTTLVYHLAHMLADMGYTVIAADMDPQANLTSMFVPDDELEQMWAQNGCTVYDAISPLIQGIGDIKTGSKKEVTDKLYLLAGSLKLSHYEDALSETWPKCLNSDERSFRVQTAFFRIMRSAAKEQKADFVLMDIGPNLGAINRAALIACDYVITPLSPDLYSWQGLKNFGGQLKKWRIDWENRIKVFPADLKPREEFTPLGQITPLGYIIMRYSTRRDRPTKSFEKWITRMPEAFRELLPSSEAITPSEVKDQYHMTILKDYFSLMPMAQEARKPMFQLKTGDGAIGAHLKAVNTCYDNFHELAKNLVKRVQQNQQ